MELTSVIYIKILKLQGERKGSSQGIAKRQDQGDGVVSDDVKAHGMLRKEEAESGAEGHWKQGDQEMRDHSVEGSPPGR